MARTSEFTNNCIRRNLYDNKCLECEIRYSLVQGKCVLPPVNCLALNTDNQCIVCDPLTSYTYWNAPLPLGQECKLITDFNGEMNIAPNPDFTKGSITYCEPHFQCKSDYLANLNPTIQKYLSCHVCKDSNRIPFISLSINSNSSINAIKYYSMWNANN